MKLLLFVSLSFLLCFSGPVMFAEAFLSPNGVNYKFSGINIITDDSMGLSDSKFSRRLASLNDGSTVRKLSDGNTKLLRENKGIKCLTTISNTEKYTEIAWEYEVLPNPDGKYFQLVLTIPSDIFPDLPPRSPVIDSSKNQNVIELNSYLSGFKFDFSGSSSSWVFEDFRHVAWCKKYRLLLLRRARQSYRIERTFM